MCQLMGRRELLRATIGSALGVASCGWLPGLATALADHPSRRRHCVLLWMSGGPSQTDTFDMKPGHVNGGEFKEVATAVPGLRFSEHLPQLAAHAGQMAVVRGVSTSEGDHARGTYLMRTGRRPGTPIRYPCAGSALAKELAGRDLTLPSYVSINALPEINPDAFGPGFLGPKYSAALVGGGRASQAAPDEQPDRIAELRVQNLTRPEGINATRAERRMAMWQELQQGFLARHSATAHAQDTVYRRAQEMMNSRDVEAFDLTREDETVRESYGRGAFGQGCLMARRLIERGVPFVEVTLGQGLGWDSHQDNFNTVRRLSRELDQGWATLMSELRDRGLLESTTILWMGEFGRTPQINDMAGRDHFPAAWTTVFAGGGIAGGQAFGGTSADGMEVVDEKVNEADLFATLCQALGVDPKTENISELGRPHQLSEGRVLDSLLTG